MSSAAPPSASRLRECSSESVANYVVRPTKHNLIFHLSFTGKFSDFFGKRDLVSNQNFSIPKKNRDTKKFPGTRPSDR